MNTVRFIFILVAFSYSCAMNAQELVNWDAEKIEVYHKEDVHTFMDAAPIFMNRWDQLPQPQFWKKIMVLSPDSCLINVATNRKVLLKMSMNDWSRQTETEKSRFKDSLRLIYNLEPGCQINVTTGKNDFYRFKEVYPSLSKGIDAFEKNHVDPWYAQAILLIESPGQLKKSSAGAFGAFQLMPGVARAQGLIVNAQKDERKDFERSAYAASKLLKKVCIPEAKRLLNQFNLSFDESDLWFRLLVLHVYHAGSLNVQAVMQKIQPKEGKELIKAMWQTSAAGFGNNSQNYTQLALAAQLILHEMIYEQCDAIFDCIAQVMVYRD
jgi:hypothetical protein